MIYRVVFSPEFDHQWVELYGYIAEQASPETALTTYTQSLLDRCESFATFPQRGNIRSDIRPGLRITHFRKRTILAFSVEADAVAFLGVFHDGLNYDAVLSDNDDHNG